MSEWIDVAAARERPGLRLVLTRGVPGPWGESAKGLFHAKGIPFARVAQEIGGENDALRAWTGRDDAPVAVWNDEPPRAGWAEIAWLAERIAPEPRLIPEDVEERARMFGLGRELAGELGLGWCRRLMLVDFLLRHAPQLPVGPYLARRYGHTPEAAAAAPARVAAILRALSARAGAPLAGRRRALRARRVVGGLRRAARPAAARAVPDPARGARDLRREGPRRARGARPGAARASRSRVPRAPRAARPALSGAAHSVGSPHSKPTSARSRASYWPKSPSRVP
jgi:hypothetical protein